MQRQVLKIDDSSNRMCEFAINQSNTSAQLAGVEGRMENLDTRLIKLEGNSKVEPGEATAQASCSNNVLG